MKKLLAAAIAGTFLALGNPAAVPAAGLLPRHAVPAGFRATDGARGGRLLTGTIDGPFSTPAQALSAALHRLRSYFTGPLPVTGAVQTRSGVVALFNAHLDRTPVVGVALVAPTAAGGALVGAVFDTPERAGRSLRTFAARSAGHADVMTTASAAVALTRERFPDGSGTIGVPAGWRVVSGTRGMVDVAGNDGAEAHIGITAPIWDPRAGLADPRRMQVPFTADPVQALTAVTNRVWSIRGIAPPPTDVLDVHPVNPPLGSGRAALVHGRVHGAEPLEFVTLVNSAPMSGSAWMFYATTLSAPPQRFTHDYPLMLEIWKSYQADPGYQHAVQADTARTLEAAANIVNVGTQRSIDAADRSQAGMENIINGNEVIEKAADGTHWLGDAGTARALAQRYPDRYRIVPTDEYRSGDY